ncbi:terpene synthase family protein [Nocardia wallacei]|uniref:terpene synthase family protein n=1 Tax=Nocardia wallacei TaxID=480035 RepID=UPI002455D7A7|nr:terpene synthase family protein [Nocardia wallacei]
MVEARNEFNGVQAARALQLMTVAGRWCSSYGFHTGAAIEATALTIAFSAPATMDVARLIPAQLVGVWLSVTDDVFDTQLSDRTRLHNLVQHCDVAAATGRCADDTDPYESALVDIVGRLSSLPDYARWKPFWHQQLRTVLREWEWAWRADHAQVRPELDEYLLHSSAYGAWPVVIALWMAAGGPEIVDPLRESFDRAQTALMLTNDLATADREYEQHTVTNALFLGAEPSRMQHLIADHLAEHKRLAQPHADTTAGRIVTRLTDFLIGLQQIDIHHPEWQHR